MHHGLINAVTAFTERLLIQAAQDDGLREDLRALAGAVLEATERPPFLLTPGPDHKVADEDEPDLPGEEFPPPVEVKSAKKPVEALTAAPPLPELTLGR